MNTALKALKDEIKNRALIYYDIYLKLAAELGSAEAVRLMGDGIYERGRAKGELLARQLERPDLERLARAFVDGKNGLDAFGHQVVEVGGSHAVLRLKDCPLVEAWNEAGLSPEEKKTMCDIACQVDFGKFEAAGYQLQFKCRIGEGAPTCDLVVTK